MKIKHPDIIEAINRWVKTRTLTDIKSDEISARLLVEKRNMKYAAALIFIDWYRENPEEAMNALSTMG